MRYAINIADATEIDTIPRGMMLAPLLDRTATVKAESGRIDGEAVLFDTQFPALRIVSAISFLQRHHNGLLRCYASKTGNGGWGRVQFGNMSPSELERMSNGA